MVIFRRLASGGASCFAAEVGEVDVGANEGSPLSFFFTMTPLSAFLTDTSFLGAGIVALIWPSLPGLDGTEGFETTGGGLLIALSLAATALRGKLT